MQKELFGVTLAIENIIVGQSSTQLTHDLFVSLVDPHDAVLLFDPTYANYAGQIKMAVSDARIVRQRVLDPDRWSFKDEHDLVEDFKEIHEHHKPKLVMIPTPDNPSSQVFGDRFVKAMADICHDADTFMLFDYAYKTQCFVKHPSYYAWGPADVPHMIAVHSNSKWGRGLGRRLGWVEADAEVVDALERVQQRSILCPDTLHQFAFTEYISRSLADGSLCTYLEEKKRAYARAASLTVAAIRKHLGMPCLEPQGGLYTLMDVGEDGDAFVARVLKNTGVLFIPGRGFGESLANGVRISYGPHVEHTDIIEAGFRRVAAYLGT
jgi:aspartate/methionine/tyrosine aminotransferase